MTGRKGLVLWLLAAAGVALLDQLSKQLVLRALQPADSVAIAPFVNLVLWFNRGAAFSFLSDGTGWQRPFLIGIALVAAVIIVWLLARHRAELLFCAGLMLVLGGALGNMWDRILHGHVIDFVLLHAGGYQWPAFNLADSAITIGAAMIIIDGFRHMHKPSVRESE
ncbi:MAG: signal peptidase II [Betaproteobacteria bacterium]|nr:signal peptidase II [Betaproteobacteria bacterium]